MEPPNYRLRRWLATTGLGNTGLGRAAGCSDSHISHIAAGRKRPSLDLAIRIERLSATWADGPIRADEWVRS